MIALIASSPPSDAAILVGLIEAVVAIVVVLKMTAFVKELISYAHRGRDRRTGRGLG